MNKATGSLAEAMIASGLISADQLKQIEEEIQKTHEPFSKILKRTRFIEEDKWISFLSSHFHIPRVEITHQRVKPEILKLIPENLIRKFGVFPLMKVGKRLTVVMSDPLNLTVIDQLRIVSGFEIDVSLATETEIRNVIEQQYGAKSEMADMVQSAKIEFSKIGEKPTRSEFERKSLNTSEDAPIVKLVNVMIANAIRDKASDIHVEPSETYALVRYRIDGVLRETDRYPMEFHSGVISRIKIMANLDIAENRIPQDGRARFESEGQVVDLRISSIPTIHGENVVLRLLNTKGAIITLDQLGMAPDRLQLFQEIIKKEYGIFLITGPTGSGKTTTLYAALNQINTVECNIVTIEDPVEYRFPLIRQIQVNPKVNLTFATGLRSVLRQDPDVIMIGEIRDRETAEIAIRAALTGHMVFSTLHTNNAASAVSRLLDMGVEPFLIASAVRGVMAQRLVRTICKDCKTKLEPSQIEMSRLKLLAGASEGLASNLYYGRGCLNCKKTGYQGRIGLFEIFIPDEAMRHLILKRASSSEIEEKAVRGGMQTLMQDGIQKMKSGLTTLEEVIKATQE